jgi:hypothetical protein
MEFIFNATNVSDYPYFHTLENFICRIALSDSHTLSSLFSKTVRASFRTACLATSGIACS